MQTPAADVAPGIRAWARGTFHTEAAAELLLRAHRGRFADPGWPWIVVSDHLVWVDVDRINKDTIGALSSGEKRVLRMVGALLEARMIDIGDVAAGIDRAALTLVLAAIAHAGGSHQHSELEIAEDGRPIGFVQTGSLYRGRSAFRRLPGQARADSGRGDDAVCESRTDPDH